jgi:hypothetical protein
MESVPSAPSVWMSLASSVVPSSVVVPAAVAPAVVAPVAWVRIRV